MARVNIMLPDDQLLRIDQAAEQEGLNRSKLIRLAFMAYCVQTEAAYNHQRRQADTGMGDGPARQFAQRSSRLGHFKSFTRRTSRKVNRYALDTSVLLRWFSQIHDADSDRALALRQEQLSEKVKLTVLDLSVYELAHVLKEGQTFDQPRIDDALASLEFMHVDIVPYSLEITRKATQIALEHSISI